MPGGVQAMSRRSARPTTNEVFAAVVAMHRTRGTVLEADAVTGFRERMAAASWPTRLRVAYRVYRWTHPGRRSA